MPLDNKQVENQNNGNPDIQPDFVVKDQQRTQVVKIIDDKIWLNVWVAIVLVLHLLVV